MHLDEHLNRLNSYVIVSSANLNSLRLLLDAKQAL
jgi:hypothetical protein